MILVFRWRAHAASSALVLASLFPSSRATAQSAVHIPPVHGALLTGQQVDLPASLQGKVAVLVVGFSQASRAQVTLWGRSLAGDYHDSPSVAYYEMPVLGSVPRLLRGWVTHKIKDQVPPRAQGHFLIVSDDEAAWKSTVGFSTPDDAYILLIDASGNVLWRTHGAATPSAYADVRSRLESLRPH